MKTMARWTARIAIVFSLVTVMVPAPATADIIEFRPQTTSVELGDSVALDIYASNLGGEIVSAFDFDITYDSLVLAATGVSFGTGLGDPFFFEVFEAFDISMPGLVDLAQLSLLPDAALFGLQGGDEVYLATLFFDSIATGVSTLDFVFDSFNDVKTFNAAVLPVTGSPGQIVVTGPPVAVPEPPTWALLLTGLVLLAFRQRRFRVDGDLQ